MAKQRDTSGWRAWAAFYMGIAQAKADPRFEASLTEAVTGGLLDTEDDDEYQRVLGEVLRAILTVPIIKQEEVPHGEEERSELP